MKAFYKDADVLDALFADTIEALEDDILRTREREELCWRLRAIRLVERARQMTSRRAFAALQDFDNACAEAIGDDVKSVLLDVGVNMTALEASAEEETLEEEKERDADVPY